MERPKFVDYVPLIEAFEHLFPRACHCQGRVVDICDGHDDVGVEGGGQIIYDKLVRRLRQLRIVIFVVRCSFRLCLRLSVSILLLSPCLTSVCVLFDPIASVCSACVCRF